MLYPVYIYIYIIYRYCYFPYRRGTHGGRRCANCRNAHFLRGTVMKASSHEKHAKKKPWKKNQTHVHSQASPQTLPMGLNFFFFCFLEVLAKLQKTMEKPKKQKKTKSSDPCPQPGLSPDLAHGSELFAFFFFFWFSRGFGQTAKNHGQTKKKTKSSDLCPQPGLSPDLAHGSELCVFFLVVFLDFSIVFCMFFI